MSITGTTFFKTAKAAKDYLADHGFNFDVKLGCWLNDNGGELVLGRTAAGHSLSVA